MYVPPKFVNSIDFYYQAADFMNYLKRMKFPAKKKQQSNDNREHTTKNSHSRTERTPIKIIYAFIK